MDILDEREKTHGPFSDTAAHAQCLKRFMRTCSGWQDLTDQQREALDMVACKVARILSGNADEPDHWRDIAGYARLGGGE